MKTSLLRKTIIMMSMGLILLTSLTPLAGIQLVAAQTSDDGWSVPVNLSQSGAASLPSLTVDSNKLYHVFWQDTNLEAMYSGGDGTNWNSPHPGLYPFTTYQPKLVSDPNGFVHAFWIEEDGALYYSRVQGSKVGLVWNAKQRLSDSAVELDVAVDETGQLHLSYIRTLELVGLPAGLYYQRLSSKSANWSKPVMLYDSAYFRSLTPADAHVSVSASQSDAGEQVYIAWDNPPRERVYLIKSADGGKTWGVLEEIDRPQEGTVSGGPANIFVHGENNEALLLWQQGQTGSNCDQFYQWSNDGGNTWGPRQRLFEGFLICPQEIQFLESSQGLVLLLVGIQVYLQAWDGTRWSDPQLQEVLSGFVDPDTQKTVTFGCQQAVIDSDMITVVGCDADLGKDIWVMKRGLADVADWYPQEAVWGPLITVASNSVPVVSPVLAADERDRTHAMWSQPDPLNPSGVASTLYYARWEARLWSQPAEVLSSPQGRSDQPALAVGGGDRLYAVWSGGDGGEIYFSQAPAGQAVVATAWSVPLALPKPQATSSSPNIVVDRKSGAIYVVYSVPLNEARGIYIVSSIDSGQTWSEPVQVFDAVGEGWEMVDSPHIAVTDNGHLHMLWTRYSLPFGPGPLGLYYARSENGGKTWSAPQQVAEASVTWSQIEGAGKDIAQRVWQETSGRGMTLWREQLANDGATWIRTAPVSIFGQTVGAPSLTEDMTGNLHLLQLVSRGPDSSVLQHFKWDGERWSAERNLPIAFTKPTILSSLGADVTGSDDLRVVFVATNGDLSTGDLTYELMSSNRSLQATPGETTPPPTVIVTPTPPTATPSPQVTETPAPSPTPTEAGTPTPTFGLVSSTNDSSNNAWIGSVAGVIVAAVIVLLIILGIIAMRFKRPQSRRMSKRDAHQH